MTTVQALSSVPSVLERAAPPGRVPPPPRAEPGPDRFEPSSAEEEPQAARGRWGAALLAAVAAAGVLGGLAVHVTPRVGSAKSKAEAPLGPWRDSAEAAGQSRPHDAREAREARRAYRDGHRALDAARDQAMADLARLGEGTHPLPEGGRLVLRRARDGVVTAHYQGTESLQVTFRTDDPGRVTLVRGTGTSRFQAARVGTLLESRVFGYPTDSFGLEGATLVRRSAAGQVRVGPDGEATLIPPDGRLATVVAPDLNRGARDQVLERASARVQPDGRREPLTEDDRARLSDALDGHAPETLRSLVDSGLTYLVVDPKAPLPPGGYPGGETKWPKDATGEEEAGGYYNQYVKAVVLRSDMLERSIVVHETAHALDDLGAPDTEGQVRWESQEETVAKLFAAYKERSADPARVWSRYALVNAQEYYAKGFEFHEGTAEDRALLKRLDPDLARFIEARLGQGALRSSSKP